MSGGTELARQRAWVPAMIVASVLPACAAAPPVVVGRHAAELELADQPEALIQMRRQGCLREPCPIYAVSIFSDGSVIYEGRANVAVIGRKRLHVTAADLSALINAIDAMDFLDSADDCCVCPDTAVERLVTVDYRPGAVTKTVRHDQLCPRAPPALSALEQQIDRSTGAGRMAFDQVSSSGSPTGAPPRPSARAVRMRCASSMSSLVSAGSALTKPPSSE